MDASSILAVSFSLTAEGVLLILYSIAPDHPFWSTPAGLAHERASPQGRNTDAVLLIWAHPRINTTPAGKFSSSFPPDMDAAFFLALLGLVDGMNSKRISMTPGVFGDLIAVQQASEFALVVAPSWKVLGPVRWWLPWALCELTVRVRALLGGKAPELVVEELVDGNDVKKK